MRVRVVSEWHVNAEGLWQNRHGWFVRRQAGTHELSGTKIFVGFRPDPQGRGDKVRPDGDLHREMIWAGGWGEVWAPDLETLMQRVDQVSGQYEHMRAVGSLHAERVLEIARKRSDEQAQLGLWPEAA